MKVLKILMYVVLLASCAVNKPELQDVDSSCRALRRVYVSAEIAGEKIVEVKSVLSSDIESRMSDITLASYGNDGLLLDVAYYDAISGSMSLLVESAGNNIYALVNMGDMTASFPLMEQEISGMEYYVRSYSDVEDRGFPMSGKLTGYYPESGTAKITVERLFAKLRVRIIHKSLAGYSPSSYYAFNLCNKSIRLRQANGRVLPFSEHGSRADRLSDILVESDGYQNLNDRNAYQGSLSQSDMGPGPGYLQDTTLILYVPENMQGNLLPHNKDPYAKNYEGISDVDGKSYSDLCTYLEFNARRENTLGYSGDVMYRYYLGADNTSDFNLERNKRYDITLDFTEDGFFVDSWKVSRGDDWTDGRILEFTGEPYLVNPGGTARIMVHYHRSGKIQADSQICPDDWDFLVDETSMMEAGLSYSFDPESLVVGEDGFGRCCVNLVADSDAKVGRSIPVKVISRDGSLSDESSVTVIARTDFSPLWSNRPEYVSQEGVMSVAGVTKDDLPLSVTLSDPSMISCAGIGEETFRIVALRAGKVQVVVSNAAGTRKAVVPLEIKAPGLVPDMSSVMLNPDGEAATFNYAYVDAQGNQLRNINASAFDTYLRPIFDAGPCFTASATSSSVSVCITSLMASGRELELGKSYEAVLSAADCPDVIPKSVSLVVDNPFEGISVRDFGQIHDYTLFVSNSVNPLLRSAFAQEIRANSSFEYQGFVPDAEAGCVSVALEPVWADGFSYPNEVFRAAIDRETSRITVVCESVSSSTRHSAGRHRMMVYVTNRYSGQKVGACCGELDLYVHAAIGAEAVFGSQMCSWKPYGNETFASVYNNIAGWSVYSSVNSSSLICYMDVYMKWMTDVSGVYVLSRMSAGVQSGVNWLDALDIVRPSVSDGELNSNTRMLYSVMNGSDSRISVCGEKYGPRRGIGGVLYRALQVPVYTSTLTDVDIKRFFLGYNATAGRASSVFAPRYTLHDMNQGADIQENKVMSRSPYPFSPSSFPSYVDRAGKGHHVIHFLEEISPQTCGWINLL